MPVFAGIFGFQTIWKMAKDLSADEDQASAFYFKDSYLFLDSFL